MTLLVLFALLASLAAGLFKFAAESRGEDVYKNIKMVSLLFKDTWSPSLLPTEQPKKKNFFLRRNRERKIKFTALNSACENGLLEP